MDLSKFFTVLQLKIKNHHLSSSRNAKECADFSQVARKLLNVHYFRLEESKLMIRYLKKSSAVAALAMTGAFAASLLGATPSAHAAAITYQTSGSGSDGSLAATAQLQRALVKSRSFCRMTWRQT